MKHNNSKKRRRKTKYERTRGAVSVFLVMILVPCLVVTSLFTDLARVKLSKDISGSAADLALNSLMTNYDADLNEWYGMVSSCQNIDEFYDISAQFFLRMLSSQDLSTEEVMLLSDYYAAATQNGAIYDFLGDMDNPTKHASDLLAVDVQTEESKIVAPVENANMANATIIKNQVIEFMKYRAPIEITTMIIDRFNKDSTCSNVEEASKNEPLVESKQDFYETEGEFTSAAYHSYWAIREYSDKHLTKDILKNDYVDKISEYKDAYKVIHTNTVKYLYNTSDLTTYSVYYPSNLDSYKSTYNEENSDVYSEKVTEDDSTTYYIDKDTMKDHLDDLGDALTEFQEMMDTINGDTDIHTYADMEVDLNDADKANPVQWWVRADKVRADKLGDVQSKAEEFMKCYAIVLKMTDCTLDDRDENNKTSDYWSNIESDSGYRYSYTDTSGVQHSYKCSELKSMASSIYDDYLDGSVSTSTYYGKFVTKLASVSSTYASYINTAWHEVTVDGSSKKYDTALNYISGQLDSKIQFLDDCIEKLDTAINGNRWKKVKSLDKLKQLAEDYRTDLGIWTDNANTIGTDMAEDDRTEISDREANELIDYITDTNVAALKTRLSNIKSLLEKIRDSLVNMKYGNKKVKEISDMSKFRNRMGSEVNSSEIPLKNSELDNYAESTFTALFEPTEIVTPSELDDAAYDPNIDPYDTNADIPELYGYMHEQFKDKENVKGEVDKAEDEQDSEKEKAKNAEEEAKKGNNTVPDGHEIKNLEGDNNIASNEEKYDLGNLVTSLWDTLSTIMSEDIASAGEDVRDAIYTTTYIREMFSFATYENEGLYGLVENKTELTINNKDTKYNEVRGDANATDPSTNKGKWLSTDLTDTYNKSVTNHLINLTNNYAYGGEIEYILYGDTNQNNINKAIEQIYTIRYALNLVSGFQHFWTDGNCTTATAINTVATAIAGATGGIIPAPVTKAVLIPILTIFETCFDMTRLKAGFPVEIYKSEPEMWWVSLEGQEDPESEGLSAFLANLNFNPFDKQNTDNGLFYSDYLTIFLYTGLTSNDTSQVMYERMAEVIQMNMRQLIDGSNASLDKGYQMKKSVVYFKLEAEVRVRPLMITLPIFNDYDNNLQTKKDWCTYKVSAIRGYS